jgi:carnosine N-methyltransferase
MISILSRRNVNKPSFNDLVALDTAPNIIRYVEAVKNCLRPGGIFVNVGPLLWHFENNAPGQHGHEKDSPLDNNDEKGN